MKRFYWPRGEAQRPEVTTEEVWTAWESGVESTQEKGVHIYNDGDNVDEDAALKETAQADDQVSGER